MADFLNKMKQSLNKSTKVIGAKSNSAIESNKVKSEISALRKAKNDVFSVIGKNAYEAYKAESFTLESIQAELESLKDYDVKIAEKEADLERIKVETDEKLSQINQEAELASQATSSPTNTVSSEDVVEVDIEVVEKTVVVQEPTQSNEPEAGQEQQEWKETEDDIN